jgi:hypothetical protein
MFKKILLVLLVAVVGVLVFAALKPAHMHVEREAVIFASPEAIFPWINVSKKADEWMPWKDSDPGVVMQYAGPEAGIGSVSYWDSKGQMGTGRAEVFESVANQAVKTKLTYTKPFVMEQVAEISLTPVEGGTKVKWSVSGESGYFFRLMGIFVSCDSMIGPEFEKGLAKLKSSVENAGSIK